MKVVSWNIAGGHTIRTKRRFDYNSEDSRYFAQQLSQVDPDVICLQEVHINTERSIATDIAQQLGNYGVFEIALSPSHIDPEFDLGMAILTRHKPTSMTSHTFPRLGLDLQLPNGRSAVEHTKALQLVTYNGVQIANMHWLPLVVFGYSYLEGEGKKLAANIEKILTHQLREPVILCGDFGTPNGQNVVIRQTIQKYQLADTLPHQPTHYGKSEIGGVNKPDCIYFSSQTLHKENAGIVSTQTDHYLCWADIGQTIKGNA